MITFVQGNLLKANAEALVNTVNTVGVMGKGIALMFKDQFPENFEAYERACRQGDVNIGKMFVVERKSLIGPRWIINFPTKKHWRQPSKLEWIEAGLHDLKRVLVENGIRSVALPPLGSGNGGLDWQQVKSRVSAELASLSDIEVIVYEPTPEYQNVSKRVGVEKLTPARALVAELVRRYWILGIECTLLEVHKLAYFLERSIEALGVGRPLDLRFEANKYGPYALRLTHLLDGLDGSYLHCSKRLGDADPTDVIWFEESKKDKVGLYLTAGEGRDFRPALELTAELIKGFESPLGMELLATVDWLVHRERCEPAVNAVVNALGNWPGGPKAALRKQKLFNERLVELALDRLNEASALS